jgi:alpha-glucosidase
MKALPYEQTLKNVTGWKKTPRGVELDCGTETCRIDAVFDDVLRIRISRNVTFDEHPSEAVCMDVNASDVSFSAAEKNGVLLLKTEAMQLSVTLADFSLKALRTDGTVVMQTAPGWYRELNNVFTVTRSLPFGDAIYGLGEKTGHSNRRGREFTLWNTDVLNPNAKGEADLTQAEKNSVDDPRGTGFDPYYVSIPFFYHCDARTGAAAGFFIDNTWKAEFEFSDGDYYRFRFHGGHYDEYIFAGPEMPTILERYTELTGRSTQPPVWALGHQQCRWAQYTEEEFLALGKIYRKKEISCDGLWLDINYMKDYRVFSWNEELFPNPGKLCAEAGQGGQSVVTIIDPGIAARENYDVYEEGMKKGMFCLTESGSVYCGQVWPGKTVFPDFFRPEVREWWAALIARHAALGVRGIWNDMNEPSSSAIPTDAMKFDGGQMPHERGHNEYALQMCRATVDGLRQARPEERPFVLSRAGSAGIQRFAAVWSGDNCSRWEHLAMSIPMLCGLGASGVPFVGADIPGFFEHADPELAVRWYQCGLFYPFFRNHSANWSAEQYPWTFGPAAEKLIREAVRFRYRLMPYLTTCFAQASESGAPVMRPLWYEFQRDPAARDADNQFLLGRDLLIAPVCEQGVSSRSVYLPEGLWYDWHSGDALEGGRWITCETPMERIGVFVRGGAVIPLWPDAPLRADGHQPETIELRLFPPRAGEHVQSLLHEDDGLTVDGEFRQTVFILSENELRTEQTGTWKGGCQKVLLSRADGSIFQTLEGLPDRISI